MSKVQYVATKQELKKGTDNKLAEYELAETHVASNQPNGLTSSSAEVGERLMDAKQIETLRGPKEVALSSRALEKTRGCREYILSVGRQHGNATKMDGASPAQTSLLYTRTETHTHARIK